ncbi:MAG: hypothetical protein ACOYBX_15065 [Mycobacterium sp.]
MLGIAQKAVAAALIGVAFTTGVTTNPIAVASGVDINVSSGDITSIHRDHTQDNLSYSVQGVVDDDDDGRDADGPTESAPQVKAAG